jgi:hypothetical protein
MPVKKVFLCHSSSDKLFVDRLASDLEKVNIGVWYDKWEIKVGDSLIEKIQDGLDKNDYLTVILSPESVISEWVKRELNSALMREIKEKKIVVLPCLLRNCIRPTFLEEKKCADFRNSYEDGFTELLLAIFPESKEVAIRSRDFRVIQYLMSGLTNTDSFGSNVLNAHQLTKVFAFRKELKGYLGLDEKKLLFHSAVAFKSANPDTPNFINNSVPVWGLVDEVEDVIRTQWIVEGIHQKIFGYMAPYFDWAITINKSIDSEKVVAACFDALQSVDPNQHNTITDEQTRIHLLKFYAKYRPDFFKDYYIKPKKSHPAIIEASTELADPLDIDYYIDIYRNRKEPEILASVIKTLIKLKKPVAIQILSEDYKNMNVIISKHEIMNMFRAKELVPELRTWLDKCSDLDYKVDIIGALGNCNVSVIDELDDIIRKHDKARNDCALIRIIGCYGNISHVDFLISKFTNKNTVLSEAIIYALGRLMREKSIDYLSNWYKTEDSNLIRGAAIETIARFDTQFVNDEIDNIAKYEQNPYMLSALIRSAEIAKSTKWKDCLPPLFNHPLLLIRVCAARSASVLADYQYAIDIVDGNNDNIVKSVFDEKLYCREPFKPDWLSHPHNFDVVLARLPLRLTWPDQPIVYSQRNLDRDRFISRALFDNEY